MSTQVMNPVTTPSLLYPQLGTGKLRPRKKFYQCPRCGGDNATRLQVDIVRKSEEVFGFMCDFCQKRWYVSSKLILNEVLEEHFQKIHKFTMTTGKEFGALLVKTPDGIRMDMLEIGEDLSVTFKKTKEYRPEEKVVGSCHSHPVTDEFSDWDLGTFLKSDWEQISVVVGSEGTVNVAVKTKETIKILDVEQWVKDNKSLTLIEKANKYRFLLFRGKVNNLKLCAGISNMTVTSLEKLFSQVDSMVKY